MKTLKDLPIGSKVKFGKYQVESETLQPIVFIKADNNHYKDSDNPSIIDHVTLIAEKIIDLRAFDAIEPNNSDSNRKSYGNNNYKLSNIRQWLNSKELTWFTKQHNADEPPSLNKVTNNTPYDTKAGFLNLFSQEEINAIVPTNLKVAKASVDGGGSEIVSDKVFLLSETEVGLGNENGIVEGKQFSMFSDNASRCINLTEQCFNNTKSSSKPSSQSSNWYWRLRTPYFSNSYCVRYVNDSLNYDSARSGDFGVRPALNLNAEVQVSDNLDSDGCYVVNTTPTISGTNETLGNMYDGFVKKYTITDAENDKMTVVFKIDDIVKQTLENQTSGSTIQFNLNTYWEDLSANTEYTCKIEVSDKYHTSTRTFTFTKKDNRILCITKAIETSREARKLTLSSILKLGEFDTLTIYVCNNGFDESPTWEECTNEYINKLPFFFKNKIKVDDKWGLSIKFDMRKHLSKIN